MPLRGAIRYSVNVAIDTGSNVNTVKQGYLQFDAHVLRYTDAWLQICEECENGKSTLKSIKSKQTQYDFQSWLMFWSSTIDPIIFSANQIGLLQIFVLLFEIN